MIRPSSWFLAPLLAVAAASLQAQAAVAMVADLAGTATVEGGGALGITAEIPAQRTVALGPGGRLVLIRMATGEQFVFVGPCKVRFSAQGQPEGARPAETKDLPLLQRGRTPVRLTHLAQAGMVMREKQMPPSGRELREEEPSLGAELEQLRPKAGAPFEERVVYAALVARFGPPGQARSLWEALARERPGDAVLKALAER
ncbi:hypothetical protein [Geothrix sp. SG200]|uniref:hypothetical protein n=1 Tax=Geothrix sp. SG200 TaxID=2922865 RepID=UPI001FAD9180|nr:hypothetical protein [Geothrix sp. SG200]